MPKYFVMATCNVFAGSSFQEAEIISAHTAHHVASDKARTLTGKTHHGHGAFAVITSDVALEKGKCYPEVLVTWKQQQYDLRAIRTMKYVIDPAWAGRPASDDYIAGDLHALGLSLDELRERYGQIAQAELDAAVAEKQAEAEKRARMFAVKGQLAADRQEITYTFPAVRGLQAARAYYVAQIPYSILVKLFVFDDEDVVPAEMRAQRVLNERRAEGISEYILDNAHDYVLPALTASVSAEMTFEPVQVAGAADRVGLLHVPLDATFLINDGQHRRRGIEHAIRKKPYLRDETIAVTIFYDEGLRRSQQMFADINGKQVKPSSAINALYDRRNPFNAWALSVLELLPEIRKRIDFENASVGPKSLKLWSVIAFKKFLSHLTGVTEKNVLETDRDRLRGIENFVVRFFAECRTHIPQWSAMVDGHISGFDVRENLVIGHAVWLEALGMFGRHALFYGMLKIGNQETIDPEEVRWGRMSALARLEPAKDSKMWFGRCVVLGKMQKTTDGVKTTAARLIAEASVPLTAEMERLEAQLAET